MSVGQIVRHFEALGRVPIDVEDVLREIAALRDGELLVRPVDEPYTEIRAAIYRSKVDDGTTYMVPLFRTEIVYSSRMPIDWQRLACVKELVHVLDPEPICTSQHDKVVELANKLAGAGDRMQLGNGLDTLADQIAKWQAVAILFPFGLWEEIHRRGVERFSCAEVASWVELPEDLVRVAMTKQWAHIRQNFLAYA